MSRAASLAFFALVAASGCAREATPARHPEYAYPVAAYGWSPPGAMPATAEPRYAALGYGAPPPALAGNTGMPTSPPLAAVSRPDVPTFSSTEIPSGDACTAELGRLGVAFHRLDEKRGIATPVEVTGKVNGIRYQAGASSSMVADCRLVVALHRVAPVLAELGVTAMRFSGAYSYRMSRVGRLSLHAHGLALDVHEVLFGPSWQSVERDFARGLPDGCAEASPPLNQLACRLRATRLFKELLTPDYDADHANHLHLAIAPIATAKPTDTPKVAPTPKAAPTPRAAPKVAPKGAPTPKAEPPKAEPPKAEPPKADPPKAAPPKAEPPKAPSKADPPKAAPAPAKRPPGPSETRPDEDEPTVEPLPEAPPAQAAKSKAKPRAPRSKAGPTRPAHHRPHGRPVRPSAS